MTQRVFITFSAVCYSLSATGRYINGGARTEVEAEILHDLHPESAAFATWCLHPHLTWRGPSPSMWTVSNVETGMAVYQMAWTREQAIEGARAVLDAQGPSRLLAALKRAGDPDQ